MKETTQDNSEKKPPLLHQPPAAVTSSKSRTQKPLQIFQSVSDQSSSNNKNSKVGKKNSCLSEEELKLAAIAIRLNVRLRISDMPVSMQEHALRYTRSLFENAVATTVQSHRLPLPSSLALSKRYELEFDELYGPVWHCVVGKSFGSFVTHSPGGFVYFSLDSLCFLLFKTEVQLNIAVTLNINVSNLCF